jgi:FkbM family methyltransferase
MKAAAYVRERWHPAFHARRSAVGRRSLALADRAVWARLDGIPWRVRLRLISHATYLASRRAPEPTIVKLLPLLAEASGARRFWDVGANFGYYGWLLKAAQPSLDVVFFEPDPRNVALIEATRARAGVDVEVRQVAASSSCGQAAFGLDTVTGVTGSLEPSGVGYSQRHWGARAATVTVDTVTLDSCRATGAPDLVKLDVEGHEAAVLEGAEQVLSLDRPVVAFECFDGGSAVFACLARHGYEVTGGLGQDNYVATPSERSDLKYLVDCAMEKR